MLADLGSIHDTLLAACKVVMLLFGTDLEALAAAGESIELTGHLPI
jgi:hypothetical protein